MRIKKTGIMLASVIGSLLFSANIYAESYGQVKSEVSSAKQLPIESAAVVKEYNKGDDLKVINKVLDEWYEIEYNKNDKAYVSANDINIYKVKATVNTNGVNVRNYPSINARVSKQFDKGQKLSAYYRVGDWYYIGLGYEPFFGYIHKSYIEDEYLDLLAIKDISEVKEIEIAESLEEQKVNEMINYAKQFVGNPYVYGGTSLTKGTDCSGFTQQVLKYAGVSLQRSSAAQYAANGVSVSYNNVKPGDLLFYGYGGRVSHVALYIGDGKVIHANDYKTGITIGNAMPSRGKPYIGAKRVI